MRDLINIISESVEFGEHGRLEDMTGEAREQRINDLIALRDDETAGPMYRMIARVELSKLVPDQVLNEFGPARPEGAPDPEPREPGDAGRLGFSWASYLFRIFNLEPGSPMHPGISMTKVEMGKDARLHITMSDGSVFIFSAYATKGADGKVTEIKPLQGHGRPGPPQ